MVWASYEYAWGGTYQSDYQAQSLNHIPIDKDHLQPLRFQGQFFDPETSLHYNRFRYYDTDLGMFIQRDPIGLLGGSNVFQYAPNPIGWVDVLGLARNKQDVIVYRALSADDRKRLDNGLDLEPKSACGCILSHVQGKESKFISATQKEHLTKRFDSGHGVVSINATKAQKLGSSYIDHKNVLQATRSDKKAHSNAKIAEEVLFGNGVPNSVIKLIKK